MAMLYSAPSQNEIVKEILKLHENGGEVLFARSHTGEQRIKVRYGFLNLRIKRYSVNYQTANAIRDAISSRTRTKRGLAMSS